MGAARQFQEKLKKRVEQNNEDKDIKPEDIQKERIKSVLEKVVASPDTSDSSDDEEAPIGTKIGLDMTKSRDF